MTGAGLVDCETQYPFWSTAGAVQLSVVCAGVYVVWIDVLRY